MPFFVKTEIIKKEYLINTDLKRKIINEHINQINEDDYIKYFNEFSTSKIKFLKGSKDQKKRSFINYFTYRGWENSLIYQKLNDIN